MSKKRQTVSATPQGLEKAQKALKRLFGTQLGLAKNLTGSVGRSTIQKFFKGEEIQVDKFKEICEALTLLKEWEAIALLVDLPDNLPPKTVNEEQESNINTDDLVQEPHEKIQPNIQVGSGNYNESIEGQYTQGDFIQGNIIYVNKSDVAKPSIAFLNQSSAGLEGHNININALVQSCREKVKPSTQQRCGTMRVLDMTQPIGLNDIYTNVNILEKINRYRRLEIEELLQNFDPESDDFDRFGLSEITQKRIPGLKAVEHHSKLMILGKPGAGKTTFLKYLAIQCINGEFQANRVPLFITLKEFAETRIQFKLQEFIIQDLKKLSTNFFSEIQIFELLNQGKFLILLDGLDEVIKEKNSRVISQIKEFSEQYYNNQFIITCRIAAQEYTFEQFNEVEVADFDAEQISDFVNKWFQAKKDTVKAKHFIEKLRDNSSISELATNPLLLTLLCLVFEERAEFPTNRSELYKEGLDVLLKKWDVKRNIERNQAYRKLSLQRKEDLLSQIAFSTFEKNQYFFKQKEIEEQIAS